MLTRIWYPQRYIMHQLHGEPVWGWRIRERGEEMPESNSDRIVAKELNALDAGRACTAVNPLIVNA